MSKENYTINDIAEMLRAVEQSTPPFYGQTIQDWQDNKVVLFRVNRIMKKETGKGTTYADVNGDGLAQR